MLKNFLKINILAAILTITGCATNAEQLSNQNENGATQSAGAAAANVAVSDHQNKINAPPPDPATQTGLQPNEMESVYTDLAAKKCKTLELIEDEGGSYRGLCDGAGGYKLELIEGDLRQTINVVAPNKKKYELNLWTVVSSNFSSVGEKAEWRMTKKNNKIVPFALVVRFNASENPEDSSKITSYLVVSKITDRQICVTDVVKPNPEANETARQLAAAAANKPCLALPN